MKTLATMTKAARALRTGCEARSESRPEGLPVTTTKDFLDTQLRCTKKAVSVGRRSRIERAAPLPRRFIPVTSM